MPSTTVTHDQGLQWLDAEQTSLLRAVDSLVNAAGSRLGAAEIIPPPLLPVETLQRFDCYENFPHLAWVASVLDTSTTDRVEEIRKTAHRGAFDTDQLLRPTLGLPTAACWGVYAGIAHSQLPGNTLFTLVSRCFRAEEFYEPLRRVLGFHMREIVAVGSYDFCTEHTIGFRQRIEGLCAALGLDLIVEPGLDPFFDKETPRAMFSKISPVKYEFVVDGISIASINNHRTFFGTNSSIEVDGAPANTSCVAFGLERWVSVLQTRGLGADAVSAAATDF